MEINWRSQQGKRTSDNRDCGGVGVRAGAVLCLVVDGSTSGPAGGELARQIIRDVIDWYVTTDGVATAESLTAQLRRAHLSLSRQFPRDSASYVITYVADGQAALVLHAGDCLMGTHEGPGPIQWLIRPHTLANVAGDVTIEEIARSQVRHRLTRSLRAREFMPPEMSEINATPGTSFIVATDGFWADLSAESQVMFIEGYEVPIAADGDDRSVLEIRRLGERGVKIEFDEGAALNLYTRKH